MSVAGMVDIGTDLWGGYVCAIPPSQLPLGASPNCQDVIFPEACVRSRPRLSSFFPSLGGNPTVNGIKTYANALANILLAWDSLGNLYQEATPGNLTLVQGGGMPNLFMNSTSLFGREYLAFGNAQGGQDIPRQFDGTNYDRVSQTGPGVAPSAADESLSFVVAAAGVPGAAMQAAFVINPAGAVENGNIVTISLASTQFPVGPQVGDSVVIAGVGVAGYNGTFQITSITQVPAQFTYFNPTSGLANSGGGSADFQTATITTTTPNNFVAGQLVTTAGIAVAGYNVSSTPVRNITSSTVFTIYIGTTGLLNSGGGTVTTVGSITAGKRQVSVAFITRQGFITCPAIPNTWTAGGGKRVVLAGIPTGPPNVVARLLLFTQAIIAPATTGTFFSLPTGSPSTFSSTMQISDNTTTTVTVDFLDSILAAGFNGQYLFAQVELGECASVNSYNSRTVWIGERNKVKADGGGGGFNNLTFDGGFTGPGLPNFPLGWTQDPVFAPGGASAVVSGVPTYWGDAYQIVGNGATATRGKITQSAFKDYLGNAILRPNTSYSVRARIRIGGGLIQGTLHLNLQSTIGGFTTTGISLTAAQLTASYVEYTAVILTAQATIPSDLTLQLYADGTPNQNGYFLIDCIEIFLTNSPFNSTIARLSHANNPESFDGVLDAVQIAAPGASASVQSLRASWQIRTNLYLAKDHYLCYVTDDGQNEPASWSITELSNTIGCCGPNAWDGTEEWVVFSERSGQYITTGSDPVKVSQEIQEDVTGTGKPNWNATNWLAGYTAWTRIDRVNKRILTGLPLNGASAPNRVFQMDYKFSPTGEAIIGAQAPTYSAFSGRILVHGSARKWAPWNVTANCCALIERPDGTSQTFFGNGAGNGKIYRLVDAATQGSDDGIAVNDFYQTYGQPSKIEEDGLQLGQHMKHFGYLSVKATGSGLLSIAATSPLRTTSIRAATLSAAESSNIERKVSLNGERILWQVGTNAVGNWFQLERIVGSGKAHPTFPVRGLSA